MANNVQKEFEAKAFGKPVFTPRFFEHARKNTTLTSGYGINVYETDTYIEIKTSGRKDTTTRKATAEDMALFEHAYMKYIENRAENYMPMEALAGYSTANLFILRDLGVTSTEELANYSGHLPLASLKLMKHCAAYLVHQMQVYTPPTFTDDTMEVPRETIQTQRQVLPSGENLGAENSNQANHEGGVRQLGVSLNENGEIIEIHGQSVQEGHQKESVQKESVQKVVSFY
jgi:hypothetical protein